MTWRLAEWGATIGEASKFALLDPTKNLSYKLGVAGHLKGTGVQYGAQQDGSTNDKGEHVYGNTTFYFNRESGNNQAGAEMIFNPKSGDFTCRVGLEAKQEDHTWRFKLHSSGLFQAALHWHMHKAAKATLNTGFNLQDAKSGKVNGVPLGLTLEVKY